MALSEWDKKYLNKQQQQAIQVYTAQYDRAAREGDREAAQRAHEGAEAIRKQEGYSGGSGGASFQAAPISTTKTTASKSSSGTVSYQTKTTNKDYDNGSLSSEQVKTLQKALGVTADGYFGPKTQAAAFSQWGVSDADAALKSYRSAGQRTSYGYDEDEGTYRYNGKTYDSPQAAAAAMNAAKLTAGEQATVRGKAAGTGVKLDSGGFSTPVTRKQTPTVETPGAAVRVPLPNAVAGASLRAAVPDSLAEYAAKASSAAAVPVSRAIEESNARIVYNRAKAQVEADRRSANGIYSNHHLGGNRWEYNTSALNQRDNYNMVNRLTSLAGDNYDIDGYGHVLRYNVSKEPGKLHISYINWVDSKLEGNSFEPRGVDEKSVIITQAELLAPRDKDGNLKPIELNLWKQQ